MNQKFTPDFEYLSHYFRTELPACFVKYYIEFGHMLDYMTAGDYCQQFIDHTGLECSQSRLRYLLNRVQYLTNAEKKASEEFDLDTLVAIRDGKYKFVIK